MEESKFLTGYDFFIYWSAGRLALEGDSPYDSAALQTLFSQVSGLKGEMVVFPNAPWIFWLIVPFAYLPFHVAEWVWLGTLTVSLVCSARLLRRLEKSCCTTQLFLSSEIFYLSFFAFPPVAHALLWGNLAPLLLTSLLFSITLAMQRKFVLCGVAASALLLKPQLLFLPAGILVAKLTGSSSARCIVCGLLLGFVIQVTLSCLVIGPNIFGYYTEWLHFPRSHVLGYPGVALSQFLSSAFPILAWQAIIPGLGFLFGMWWHTALGRTREAILCLAAPAALLACPYLWPHTSIVGLAGFQGMIKRAKGGRNSGVRYLLFLLAIYSAFIAFVPRYDFFTGLFPAAALLLNFPQMNAGRAGNK